MPAAGGCTSAHRRWDDSRCEVDSGPDARRPGPGTTIGRRRMRTLTLSVLDQSPVRDGGTAAQALRETVALAQAAERLGYRRFWVAEHHNSAMFAGTAPEILIGQIAANTTAIRVGSGGVMLSHYSALKVAETFRILAAFYPGRIDLGLGRAPGSDPRTAVALAHPKAVADIQEFPGQV